LPINNIFADLVSLDLLQDYRYIWSVQRDGKEAAIADKLLGSGVLNHAPPVRQYIEFALG